MSHLDPDDGSGRSDRDIDRHGHRSRFREDSPTGDRHHEEEAPQVAVAIEEEATATVISPEQLARSGYTSDVEWENLPADVVVICCSDQRFGRQNRQFLRALGYDNPHFIQVPSGLAVFHGLAAVSGFLPKAMERLLEKAIDLTQVKEVICIAHHDCGGYKLGRIEVLGKLTRRLAGLDIKDVQEEHLIKAARELQTRLGSDVTIRAFYADVVGPEGSQKVNYGVIDTGRRRRSKTA